MIDIDVVYLRSSWVTSLDLTTMRKAALTVCGNARDKDDAIVIMTALGLISDPEHKPPIGRNGLPVMRGTP